ncbi:DUF4893 domain-containing protein [Palleronia rufa]|uniref:DUF4893 domain-containing protein n=1 Tax=Palleronia rufa TaxID=1530186 RepID=UPI00056C4A6B|nr:DUF4893 domain-containing protein [Palleronia rufa]
MRWTSLILAVWIAAPAVAAPDIRAADLDRLQRFDEAAGAAILGALAGGATGDVAILTDALSGTAQPPAPDGDWACRTIKMGGITDLVVYTPFRCRIVQLSATEWRFEKLTGSQLTRGTIAFHEGRAIYRGVGYVKGGPAYDYADLPAGSDPIEPGQTVPEVAVFEQTGPDRARLLFPYPVLESRFDILVLTR